MAYRDQGPSRPYFQLEQQGRFPADRSPHPPATYPGPNFQTLSPVSRVDHRIPAKVPSGYPSKYPA
jgi:hypothetical protein